MNKRYENLGEKWFALLDNPEKDAFALMPRVVKDGGTRETWSVKKDDSETVLMAWPADTPLRAGLILRGKPEKHLDPVSMLPLLEGLPHDLTVEEVHPWSNGVVAYVGACRNEGALPLFFCDPLYFRDARMLSTPGVRQTFLLAGMAYGVRRALLDEMTITEGPEYEAHAKAWMEQHPGSARTDVPQLKIDLRGKAIFMPGDMPGNYQLRAPLASVDEVEFDGRKIYMLRALLGEETPSPIALLIYASEKICKNYVPKQGDEIDALLWLQGRLLD